MNIKTNEATSFEKVEYILNSLAKGIQRNKLAKELGYTNPKSLDIYMRRKGFLFDRYNENYTPIKTSEIKDSKTFDDNKRIKDILILFSRGDNDSRKISELTGFNNHIELAEFMKKHNYNWNEEYGNYVKILDKIDINDSENNSMDMSEFFMYLPLLRQLNKNKTKLIKFLDSQSDGTAIPDYSILGTPTFTTISINENLNNLVKQFSAHEQINSHKIFEIAVIDFLRNYGFDNEVNGILETK
jgi:hypothetical protein